MISPSSRSSNPSPSKSAKEDGPDARRLGVDAHLGRDVAEATAPLAAVQLVAANVGQQQIEMPVLVEIGQEDASGDPPRLVVCSRVARWVPFIVARPFFSVQSPSGVPGWQFS
jgi:hypothetical protein